MATQDLQALILDVLQSHPHIHTAILFGSLAKQQARPDSDVDVAVMAAQVLNLEQKYSLIEDLALALGRPVDLIDLSKASEPLLGQILSTGQRLLGDSECYARLLTRHLMDEADFGPLQKHILDQRRARWLQPK